MRNILTNVWLVAGVFASTAQDETELEVRWRATDAQLGLSGSTAIAIAERMKAVAYPSRDDTIRSRDLETGGLLVDISLESDELPLRSIDFAPGAKLVAAGGGEFLHGVVSVREFPSGRNVARFMDHGDRVTGVAFSPSGKLLASASFDGTVKIRRVADGRVVRDFAAYSLLTCLAFSPDDEVVASGGYDSLIYVWGVRSGQLLSRLDHSTSYGQNRPVLCLAFSLDGRQIASGTFGARMSPELGDVESVVNLWRRSDGALIESYPGDPLSDFPASFNFGVTSLVFSHRNALVWGTVNGKIRFEPSGISRQANGSVAAVATSRFGHFVAFGRSDGVVAVATSPDEIPK